MNLHKIYTFEYRIFFSGPISFRKKKFEILIKKLCTNILKFLSSVQNFVTLSQRL